MEHKTIRFVSVYRFVALALVLYAHLITVPSYAYDIPNVIKGTLDTPILDHTIFTKLDSLLVRMKTNSGSLGVVMFFITSGYLAGKMIGRYNRREYLVNRAISTFPTLWSCIAIVALVVFIAQGITFSPYDFINSAFPSIYWLPGGGYIILALWTMRIEILFYVLVAIFMKSRIKLVLCSYLLIFLSAIVYYEWRTPLLFSLMQNMSFVCFSLVGVLIESFDTEETPVRKIYIAASVLLNILIFKVFAVVFQDADFRALYVTSTTHIIPVVLFLMMMKLENRFPKFYDRIPKFVYASGKLLLPIYLTHVACGITVMYWMNVAGCSPYLTVLGGVVASFVVAWVIYRLVQKPSGVLMKKVIARMRQNELR